MTYSPFTGVELELTAETPIASTVPEPWGKPYGPGLWRVKGMQLPHYIQHVSHDLFESGQADTVQKAIQMAVGIVRKWSQGIPVGGETKVGRAPGHPGRIHPDVQAAAGKAMVEWEQKRARAHAQSAARAAARAQEHSVMQTEAEATTVELAGATPVYTGNPGFTTGSYTGNQGYGAVSRQRREHVHRGSGGAGSGGLMDMAEMSGKEIRHHMQSFHAMQVGDTPVRKLRAAHDTEHRQKRDNPPDRDNGSMSRSRPRRGRPPGSKNKPKAATADTRGGPGPGGVSTGEANTGYPRMAPAAKPSGRYQKPLGTTVEAVPGAAPSAAPAAHHATGNVRGTGSPPAYEHKTSRPLRQSGANRQQGSPSGGDDGDMDSSLLADKPRGRGSSQHRPNDNPNVKKATPARSQVEGQTDPQAMKTAHKAANYQTSHSYSTTYDAFGQIIELAAVPSPTAATRKAALAKGEALPHESGSPGRARFPLTNRTLAGRAVKMVQFAKGDKAKVRSYIMRVLRKKGWSDLIPDNWTSEGQSTPK
jgi:hypothetical protein